MSMIARAYGYFEEYGNLKTSQNTVIQWTKVKCRVVYKHTVHNV